MKKISLLVCTILGILLSFGLTACGSTYAKVTGVMADIGTEQYQPLLYGNPLLDNQTIAENDYNLQVGQDYLLGVTYTESGGSILTLLSAGTITLKYDSEVLEITPPDEKMSEVVYYHFTCKKAVVNTAIIVEADNNTHSGIYVAYNNVDTAKLDIDFKNQKGEEITGTKYYIYDENGNLIQNITGFAGKNIHELPLGKYYVQQYSTDSIYLVNSNKYEVELNKKGETVKLEITNDSLSSLFK